MKIYVVAGSSGQWSDSSYWVERVYKSKEDADRFVSVETIEMQRRRDVKLTEEEEVEFQEFAEVEDFNSISEPRWLRYRELSDKRYDSEAHDFNGYDVEEFELL